MPELRSPGISPGLSRPNYAPLLSNQRSPQVSSVAFNRNGSSGHISNHLRLARGIMGPSSIIIGFGLLLYGAFLNIDANQQDNSHQNKQSRYFLFGGAALVVVGYLLLPKLRADRTVTAHRNQDVENELSLSPNSEREAGYRM